MGIVDGLAQDRQAGRSTQSSEHTQCCHAHLRVGERDGIGDVGQDVRSSKLVQSCEGKDGFRTLIDAGDFSQLIRYAGDFGITEGIDCRNANSGRLVAQLV